MDKVSAIRLLFFSELQKLRKSIWPTLTKKTIASVQEILLKNGEAKELEWLTKSAPSTIYITSVSKSMLIFLGFDTGIIELWSPEERLAIVKAHRSEVKSFVSLKNDFWVSGSHDGWLYIWQGFNSPKLSYEVKLPTYVRDLFGPDELNEKQPNFSKKKKSYQSKDIQYFYATTMNCRICLVSSTGFWEFEAKTPYLENIMDLSKDHRKNRFDEFKAFLQRRSQSTPNLRNVAPKPQRKKTF